jgi:hypothetical protein
LRIDELQKTGTHSARARSEAKNPLVYIQACFDKISLLYTVHLQYADDVSGVDKMNGVNYRPSYDRWRLGVR